jgi:hypothetical protein
MKVSSPDANVFNVISSYQLDEEEVKDDIIE